MFSKTENTHIQEAQARGDMAYVSFKFKWLYLDVDSGTEPLL